MNLKKLIGLIAVIALFIAVLVLGGQVLKLAPQVQEEMRTTPTPTPRYGNVMAVTPDPSLPTSVPVLKNGSAGNAVRELQTRLQELGYYDGEIDGQFGNGTRAAVVLFQQQHSLDADGVVGQATSALLYSEEAQPMAMVTETPTVIPSLPEPSAAPASVSGTSAITRKPYLRPDGLPLLVNRENPLPDDYEPYDLVKMNDYCDPELVKIKYSDTYAEREAVDALMVMLQAAHEEGITVWQISAAYRTEAYQQRLFDQQVEKYISQNGLSRSKAISATRQTVADPGTSEHHLGMAFDITVPGVSFAGTEQAKWLAKNCWDYGFILRYSKEKESITGFLAEAWHFRYVGTLHSLVMRDENLCLEEYLDKYGAIVLDE